MREVWYCFKKSADVRDFKSDGVGESGKVVGLDVGRIVEDDVDWFFIFRFRF